MSADKVPRYSEILEYHNVDPNPQAMEGQQFNGQ
jgi:hypothetical protein